MWHKIRYRHHKFITPKRPTDWTDRNNIENGSLTWGINNIDGAAVLQGSASQLTSISNTGMWIFRYKCFPSKDAISSCTLAIAKFPNKNKSDIGTGQHPFIIVLASTHYKWWWQCFTRTVQVIRTLGLHSTNYLKWLTTFKLYNKTSKWTDEREVPAHQIYLSSIATV